MSMAAPRAPRASDYSLFTNRFPLRRMVLRRQFVHRLYHGARVLRIDFGMNAVAQVEHVAMAVTVARQYARDLFADSLRRCVEHARIEVALQRHLVLHGAPRVAEV